MEHIYHDDSRIGPERWFNAGKNLRLVVVDGFPDLAVEAICRRNLAPFGGALMIFEEASPGAVRHFADRSPQFVFIDGDHCYDAVRTDIRVWASKVAAGGVLAGDDYSQREPDDARPALSGPPCPVGMAMESALGRDDDVMVRNGRGIWWKRI